MATIWSYGLRGIIRFLVIRLAQFFNLLDSILHFVILWTGNFSLPLKRKVEASILIYELKRMRNPEQSSSASSALQVPPVSRAPGLAVVVAEAVNKV